MARGPGSDVLGRLRKILKEGTFKVTYDVKLQPSSGLQIEGMLTLAGKPPASLFGINGLVNNSQTNFLIIDDGTSSFTCIESQGQKQCLKGKSGGATASPLGNISVDAILQGFVDNKDTAVKPIADQTIAGAKGKCFDVDGPTSKGSLCATEKEGLLLLLDGTFNNSKVSLKAKDVNFKPTDDE